VKTINDLKDELSIQFGTLMTGLTPGELDLILTFILTSFAYDFPEVGSRLYILPTTGSFRLYLDSIHDEFLEMKYMIPKQRVSGIAKSIYDNISSFETLFTEIDELYAIQLTNEYIASTSTHFVPRKPMIMSDATGDYVLIDKDMIVVYVTERVIDPNLIKEYVYAALRSYAYYKFIDFVINRQFSNLMDVNQKVFDLVYDSISTDISTGDLEQVTSVSLSGLSVSFQGKLKDYASTLSSMAGSFSNPTFVEEMNKMKDTYQKKFKRKKNVFYNYIF
jgi:hypothetical protein